MAHSQVFVTATLNKSLPKLLQKSLSNTPVLLNFTDPANDDVRWTRVGKILRDRFTGRRGVRSK
jgi:hypothetical protein